MHIRNILPKCSIEIVYYELIEIIIGFPPFNITIFVSNNKFLSISQGKNCSIFIRFSHLKKNETFLFDKQVRKAASFFLLLQITCKLR